MLLSRDAKRNLQRALTSKTKLEATSAASHRRKHPNLSGHRILLCTAPHAPYATARLRVPNLLFPPIRLSSKNPTIVAFGPHKKPCFVKATPQKRL